MTELVRIRGHEISIGKTQQNVVVPPVPRVEYLVYIVNIITQWGGSIGSYVPHRAGRVARALEMGKKIIVDRLQIREHV
ncbi:MAG TPA: hypothetical protein VHE32_10220, partial [Rhodanobacteraceae bacterium]|nr:hypothetical protein [Rhodanobacteraceae bacterium]